MNLANLEQQIHAAQQRWESIQQYANPSCNQKKELLDEVTNELSFALEELSVAVEELQQQNDELIATRHSLEQEHQRYRDLFEFAPDGYLVTDGYGIIQEANCAAAVLFKMHQKFMVGKPLIVFMPDEERDIFYTQLNRLTQLQQLKDWEMSLQPRGHEPIPVTIAVSAVYDSEGVVTSLRWLIRDLTAVKQAEATRRELEHEKETNELKSQFIQTVSHEFRTPFSTILLSADILEQYSHRMDEEKKGQHFRRIRTATQYATQLMEEVLLYSNTETHKLECNPAIIDLAQFCQKLAEEQQHSANTQQIIRFTSSGSCHSACLDQKLLQQILSNLVSNALKYSPEKSVVEFSLSCEDRQAVFQIQDQGIGIPLEDQLQIFKSFHRGKNVGNIRGIGLGLAIVKKAVEFQGGTISCESEVGVGTTFIVTLPLNRT